ncbi:MAG: SH3 domain-containing protein [Pseudomonadota bacterium]
MMAGIVRAILFLLCVAPFPALASEEVKRGSETNFPIPRFVSLKATEANIRRGPSLSHRIDWVFTRRDMPLQVTAEHGHWRRVRDRDGQGGWIHYSLISGSRTVLVEEDMLGLFPRPAPEGQVIARLELGVLARLGKCTELWCKVTAGGYKGWVPKTSLWGVDRDEIRR